MLVRRVDHVLLAAFLNGDNRSEIALRDIMALLTLAE